MTAPLALAQEMDEEIDEAAIEEIVVTGKFRRSLIDAIDTKRNNSQIVEAISAEDIGKLPDSSIAESLARLPGLAGERRNGRTSGLSVRGFREDYVGTMLNGREVLGIGDNRGVEYDLYPAEIISGVVVYKTPNATLTTQGIGGIVDLRTVRPLDVNPYVAFNGVYESNELSSGNPDFDDTGHRLSLSFANQFADDTIGVALAIATTESPSQEEHFRGWGYPTLDGNQNVDPGVTVNGDENILGGHDSFIRSAVLERDTIAGIVQFEPTDALSITLDALYIDFTEEKVFRGIEEGGPVWGGSDYTITGVEDGLVTEGYFDNFFSVIRNDGEDKSAELTTFGLNVAYDIGDNWTVSFDGTYGESSKTITNIESYSGVGRANLDTQGDPTPRAWVMTPTGAIYSDHPTLTTPDFGDFDLIRLAGPQSWGGSLAPVSEFDNTGVDGVGPVQAQDGFINEPDFDEDLTTIRLSADRALDTGFFTDLQFGIEYKERSKTKDNRGFYLTAPTFPFDGPIPEEYRLGTADLSFLGISGGVVAYDGIGMFRDGYYIATDAQELETGRLGDSYTIDEELLTLFARVDFETELGGAFLSGNLGLQFIDVDQEGSGFDSVTGEDLFVDATPIPDGDSYSDVLPSLNVTLDMENGHLFRFAASQTVSRARMDDMRPNRTVSFNFNFAQVSSADPLNGPWSGSSGNSRLQPLEATQFDLAYDWYYAEDGFLSAAFFYKDLTNWHRDGQFIADFSQFYIPGYHEAEDPANPGTIVTPQTFLGLVSFKEDGLEGEVRGLEFQVNVPFHLMNDALDGLGLIASAAFSDGEFEDGNRIPGLSDEAYQATLYYERAGFQIRVSGTKRSKFQTEVRGLSLRLDQTIDQGAEIIDAQIGYDFGQGGWDRLDGLYIALQGQNLTDEDTIQANADSREVTQYQSFGANYLLNVIYKFQ